MDDVLGGRTDPERFARFLAGWETMLNDRITEAVQAFGPVAGVAGLMLAGGLGRGAPWPLSDIDLIPIYDDDRVAPARTEIERRRLAILPRWLDQGWWTGLDIGRLAFTRREVRRAIAPDGPGPAALLADDRWYHSLDKGFGGRAVYDRDGTATALAAWFTRYRFDPTVVGYRLAREQHELGLAQTRLHDALSRHDPGQATMQLRTAVKWLQTWLLESWGERDNSQGRLGTRFERQARDRGRGTVVDALDALSDLDEAMVRRRMAAAPGWVRARHDCSWRARRHVGEEVTAVQDKRDTLRVCALYTMRQAPAPPYPAWLSIPSLPTLEAKAADLDALVKESGNRPPGSLRDLPDREA